MICTTTNRIVVTHVGQKLLPPKSFESAQKMAVLREKRFARAMAALTDEQRAAYPSLSPANRLYVVENCAWPDGKARLPKSESAAAIAGSRNNRSKPRNLAGIETALAWLGQEEMTSYQLYKDGKTGHGMVLIRDSLELAVKAGFVTKRQCGVVARYRAVSQ